MPKRLRFLIFLILLIGLFNANGQNMSIADVQKYLVGNWLDTSDSNHILSFSKTGYFKEYPAKFMVNSKIDTIKGKFRVEYDAAGTFSQDDTIGSGFVVDCDPASDQGNIEFKRRVMMFQLNFMEIATWKGGPYLFRRKPKL